MPTTPSLQATALDHLRVIRTLMERSNIYRAVSAPAALIGGLLSLGVAIYGISQNILSKRFSNHVFFYAWLGVLVITSIINLFLLMRESGSKGQPTITDGLRMALRAIVPPMLTGGVLGGSMIWFGYDIALGAIVWVLCYGMALQATVSFAPRSIILLARAFLITGQVLAIIFFVQIHQGLSKWKEDEALITLGLTFGLYHIVYAIAIFCTKRVNSDLSAENDAKPE